MEIEFDPHNPDSLQAFAKIIKMMPVISDDPSRALVAITVATAAMAIAVLREGATTEDASEHIAAIHENLDHLFAHFYNCKGCQKMTNELLNQGTHLSAVLDEFEKLGGQS